MNHLRSKCTNLRDVLYFIPNEFNVSRIFSQNLINHNFSLATGTAVLRLKLPLNLSLQLMCRNLIRIIVVAFTFPKIVKPRHAIPILADMDQPARKGNVARGVTPHRN